MIIVKGRIVAVALEHGDGGGLRLTAKTPPARIDAATRATIAISLVLNDHTKART